VANSSPLNRAHRCGRRNHSSRDRPQHRWPYRPPAESRRPRGPVHLRLHQERPRLTSLGADLAKYPRWYPGATEVCTARASAGTSDTSDPRNHADRAWLRAPERRIRDSNPCRRRERAVSWATRRMRLEPRGSVAPLRRRPTSIRRVARGRPRGRSPRRLQRHRAPSSRGRRRPVRRRARRRALRSRARRARDRRHRRHASSRRTDRR
jgi:hypothetical protein